MVSRLSHLRLALIAHRFQKNDGQGRVNYEVAKAALVSGIHLTLLCAYCADEIAQYPNVTVVRIGYERLPTQLARNLAFAFASARWLRKNRRKFDLVQANGFITFAPCDIVTAHFVHSAWIRNKYYPFKNSFRPYALYQRLFSALNAKWERTAFCSAGHIIAVSETVAQDVSSLGVPKSSIEIIYNGVDTSEFYPGLSERASFRLPENVPMAVFVGDIRSPRKNLATLLRAMRQLPSLHLAVAGTFEGSPALQLAHSLGIADRVHFLGKTSRIPALMRSVDIFCLPSHYEPWGLVVLEAMATGLPSIVSRNVGAVKGFEKGLMVLDDPDDAHSITLAISNLLGSPQLFEDKALTGRELAMTVSWSETAAAYLRTYQRLLP